MVVESSHLALRFYKHHGWTKEILDYYITQGRVLDVWEDQEVRDYWFLDHTQNSKLDIERLYSERISEVRRWNPETTVSDLQYLKGMNW